MVHINKYKAKERLESRAKSRLKSIKVDIEILNEMSEEQIEEEMKCSELDELLSELSNITSKRTLQFWVSENKDWINSLVNSEKNQLINQIRSKFYPFD